MDGRIPGPGFRLRGPFGPSLFLLFCLPLPAQDHKAQARRLIEETWFQNRVETARQLLAAEYTAHDPRSRQPVQETPAMLEQSVAWWREIGEISGQIDYQVAEGDRVTTAWTLRIKLRSWFRRTAAARDTVEIPIVQTFRFASGRVVEVWNYRDDQGLQEQLGASRMMYAEGFLFGAVLAGLFLWFLQRK